MFQIYGDYNPFHVLSVAQEADPSASFFSWDEETQDLARVILKYRGQSVTVSFTPRATSLLCVDGPHALEVALLSRLGGMREAGGDVFYAPLTTYLSSEAHKEALKRLGGTILFYRCRRAGMMPTYSALASMDLTPRPLRSGQTYLAHDCFSVMQEVFEALCLDAGMVVQGDTACSHGVLVVSYKGQSVEVEINRPGSDLVLLDLVQRRPGLFDGLGAIRLPEETPETALVLSRIRSLLPRSAQELYAFCRTLNPLGQCEMLPMAEILSSAQKTCVNDMTHWRGSITMTSRAFNQSESPVYQGEASADPRAAIAGVVSQPMMNSAALPLLSEGAAAWRDVMDVFKDLIALHLPKPLRVVRCPDPSGASLRDVLAIYRVGGGREEVAYVVGGGAYATSEDRRLMSMICVDTPRPYPFSIGGHPGQAACVYEIMKTTLRARSMEDYTSTHTPQRERRNYLRRAAQGIYFLT